MMENVLGILCYGIILIFGVAVSACFAGVTPTKRNIICLACFSLMTICLQVICWLLFGFETTQRLYPFIAHAPLVVFLILVLKCPPEMAVVSVLCAYLCCPVPRWCAMVSDAIWHSTLSYYITYILAIFIAFYILQRYVARVVFHFMSQSKKFCLLLGALPCCYYLFDYATVIYTDLFYRGLEAAAQFMPSIVGLFYFVFLLVYDASVTKQVIAKQERDQLALQLQQANREFSNMKQQQQTAAIYRHDMRHHFTLLQGYAAEGRLDRIQQYLQTVQSDIEALTPQRFCQNETINVVLSSFAAKATAQHCSLHVCAQLPQNVPIADTELCSVLSNGLEHAITAAAACADLCEKRIEVMLKLHRRHLLIEIKNPYKGQVVIKDKLPQTNLAGHGYGTRSIAEITKAHQGQYSFQADGGIFTLRIMLPL